MFQITAQQWDIGAKSQSTKDTFFPTQVLLLGLIATFISFYEYRFSTPTLPSDRKNQS